jgi:hypothetical protein
MDSLRQEYQVVYGLLATVFVQSNGASGGEQQEK